MLTIHYISPWNCKAIHNSRLIQGEGFRPVMMAGLDCDASGRELIYLIEKFRNLPFPQNRLDDDPEDESNSVVWRGDLANFIVDNLV